MTTSPVILELGPITVIRLNKPPMNLVSKDLLGALDTAIEAIEASIDVRAVVLAAEGTRAFSAGSDVTEFVSLKGRVGEGKLVEENAVYDRLAAIAVPTVAAIEGDALGGGLELALCCDFRVGSENARFGLPELRLGVIPGSGGTQRLPRLIGLARAKELILLGDLIGAERAFEIGLLNRVAPAGLAADVAWTLAETIAARGPIAVREAKRVLDAAGDSSFDEGQALALDASERVFSSEDMVEGASAFLEKRTAEFENH